jgi:hypothetical protein
MGQYVKMYGFPRRTGRILVPQTETEMAFLFFVTRKVPGKARQHRIAARKEPLSISKA